MKHKVSKALKEEAWKEINYAFDQFGEGLMTFERLRSVVLNYVGHLTWTDLEEGIK